MLPLAQPDLGSLEERYVLDVLRSGRLAMGPYTERFEAAMASLAGTRHGVAVSSGTAALHLIVRGLGLQPGDEVITTPYSFVASSNVLLYEQVTPRFVDIERRGYGIDVAQIEAAITERTRGVLAVDVFGQPADWPALTALAERHGLVLIDDACEAPGATVGGRRIGSWGDAAGFGFYPNKQLTTGEGGCLTTDDDALAAFARSARNQGRAHDARMEHVRLGFNYRLDELSAAVGLAQVERAPELLAARARVAALYADALADQPRLRTPTTVRGARSWFVYVVELAADELAAEDLNDGDLNAGDLSDAAAATARDALMARLRADGIGCAPYFPTIHLQPLYRERFGFAPGVFPVAEAVASRTLALPFTTRMTESDVAQVADALARHLPAVLDAALLA
ncbi:MAG: DegT/DnrJ/EryC1/StrS family aminotransferase [Bacteroidota bacterium]